MFFEKNEEGFLARVRITPNSSSCRSDGIFIDAFGVEFLKIHVISVPEKGKANKELIVFLSKALSIAKSEVEIVSGESDRYKKLKIFRSGDEIATKLEKLIG